MRESCKSGSVGEAAGDRRLYPTAWCPRLTAAMISSGSATHWKGFDWAL